MHTPALVSKCGVAARQLAKVGVCLSVLATHLLQLIGAGAGWAGARASGDARAVGHANVCVRLYPCSLGTKGMYPSKPLPRGPGFGAGVTFVQDTRPRKHRHYLQKKR